MGSRVDDNVFLQEPSQHHCSSVVFGRYDGTVLYSQHIGGRDRQEEKREGRRKEKKRKEQKGKEMTEW